MDAQYETTTPAFRLTTEPTTGSAFPGSDPYSGGNRPQAVLLQAETQNIRFTTDGSAPTSSYGMILVADAEPTYYAGPLNQLRFIQAAGGAVLNVTYLASALEAAGPQGMAGAQGASGPTGPPGGVISGAARWIGPYTIGCFDGQYINGTGTASGGSMTLTVNGETTAAITWTGVAATNATAIQAALEALPSIGAGNVTVSEYMYAVFKSALAEDIMTADSALLTGPDAPYTVLPVGSQSWSSPLAILAEGDIIEDAMTLVPVAFTGTGPILTIGDDPDSVDGSAPAFNPFRSNLSFDLESDDGSYTNFQARNGATIGETPSAQFALVNYGIDAASVVRFLMPAVAKNTVQMYASVSNISEAPTDGTALVWVKVATPVAP